VKFSVVVQNRIEWQWNRLRLRDISKVSDVGRSWGFPIPQFSWRKRAGIRQLCDTELKLSRSKPPSKKKGKKKLSLKHEIKMKCLSKKLTQWVSQSVSAFWFGGEVVGFPTGIAIGIGLWVPLLFCHLCSWWWLTRKTKIKICLRGASFSWGKSNYTEEYCF